MGSNVGKILGTIAPIAAAFIPGVGPLAAAAIGAGSGLLSGGGLKGALLGGVTGGLGAGVGSQIGGSLLGEAASSAGSRAIGGALTGGIGGLASGNGVKGALLGAGLGGAGGYALGGGLDDTLLGRTVSDGYNGVKDAVSSGADSIGLGGLLGSSSSSSSSGSPGLSGVSSAPGGTASNGVVYGGSSLPSGSSTTASGLNTALNSGTGGGASSYVAPALGALNSLYANQKAQEKLESATDSANAQLNPYTSTGGAAEGKLSSYLGLTPNADGSTSTSADILAASPGYQFTQQQGEQALARKQAATGDTFSGAALKAASDYQTGLSNQTANDYYTKLAQTSGQGLQAAGQYGTNTTALGSAGANADIQTGNTISQLLSGIGKRFLGYGSNGQPVYA